MIREYPDEPAGSFPEPPRTFTDREGRTVRVEAADEDDREALVDMYVEFAPEDRAQGIPPSRESAIRRWLDDILAEECLNVLAWHGDDAVGHATLVPDEHDAYELAIFVLAEYQGASIGTELVETLLGYGAAEGIEHVWLTVERWNDPAVALYKKVGFETTDSERFELEMAISLH